MFFLYSDELQLERRGTNDVFTDQMNIAAVNLTNHRGGIYGQERLLSTQAV